MEENKALKTEQKESTLVAMAKSEAYNEGVSQKSEDPHSVFLKTLIVKREEVEKALKCLMDAQKEYENRHFFDDFIEELDHAGRETSTQMHYKLLERKNRDLEKIEMLIRRAQQEEEFGLCEECGERIPDERLEIVPESTRCVPCQRELEKLELGRSLTEKAYRPSVGKKRWQWERNQESNDQANFINRPELEHLSFSDLEETDLEDNSSELR